MPIFRGVPDSSLEQEGSLDRSAQQGPMRHMLSSRVLGALLGLTLFGFYLSILARNDIGALLTAYFSGLPGSRFLVPILLAVAAVALSGVLVARRVTWSGWRIWREASVRAWVGEHAVVLSLVAITAGALAVRIFGISDNLPYINYPDEPAVADRALKILQTGDYNPHYFVYPSLYYYMQAGVYLVRFFALVSSGNIVNLEGAQPTDFYLWGRILTATLGALTVPLVYAAGRRLYGAIYGTVVGLVGAVFMATSTLHIVFSQLITTDVPATFFSALSFLMIARLVPEEATAGAQAGGGAHGHTLAPYGRYIAAGAAMGFALSTKYNSALVLLPFLLVHLYAAWDIPGDRLRAFLGARIWVGLGTTIAAFLITTPFAIFDLPTFLNDVASVISHYNVGHLGHEGDNNWLFYIQRFLSTDTLPTILALAGVMVAFARHRREDIIMLSFPLVFYLSISSYRVNFTRNLLPILPFTSILAALPLALLWRWALNWAHKQPVAARRRTVATISTWLLAAVVALMVLPATQAAVQRGYRQSQPDTRVQASQWLDTHTRPGTKLWLEANGPALTPNRYITAQGDRVIEHPMDWYVVNRFDYLVLNTNAYKAVVYDQPASDPQTRNAYLALFQDNEQKLAVSFDTNETDTGPSIKIYRTGYAPPQSAQDVEAQHSVGATFHEIGGDHATVQLIGADYPDKIAADSALPLVLYWISDKKMSTAYTVFVHLVNKAGDVPVQHDTGPRNGTYPTSAWSPGEVTVDEAYLNLPQNLPPGNYTLRAGIYLQQSGTAVGAFTVGDAPSGGQDHVIIGPVTITAHQ